MAKQPNQIVPVWKGLDGKLYRRLPVDDLLVGYGNPPSDPKFQADNPGAGRVPLREALAEEIVGEDGEVTYKEVSS